MLLNSPKDESSDFLWSLNGHAWHVLHVRAFLDALRDAPAVSSTDHFIDVPKAASKDDEFFTHRHDHRVMTDGLDLGGIAIDPYDIGDGLGHTGSLDFFKYVFAAPNGPVK